MSLTRFLSMVGVMLTVTHLARGQESPAGRSGEPLTLPRVLSGVAQRHPLVLAAEARVRAARGTRLTSGAWANPILTYEVENAPWPGGEPISAADKEVMVSAMVPLQPIYQRWSRVAGADAEVRAAEAAYATVQRSVQLDASRTFYRLALAQVAVEAAAEVERWVDSLVTYTRTRVDEGVAAEFDLLRLQVERDRARAETALRRVDVIRASADLQSHLGASSVPVGPSEGVDPTVLVSFPDTTFEGEPRPFEALMALALERRPELAETRERIAASRATTRHERTLIIRELSAMIGTKRIGGQRSLMAGLSAPLPLFDQNRGEIRRASAERAAAQYEHVWAERTISAEVNAAYQAVRALSAQATSLQGMLTQRAEEMRRITLGAYAEGATTLLQVLDAARATAEARVSFYELLFAQHEAVLELRSAVGASLMEDADPRASPAASRSRRSSP